jgi:predicted transposase YdaD
MPRFDTALKLVLQKWGASLLSLLAGEPIASWCPTEFPKVSTQYADLLARTVSGRYWHLELQATNDDEMAWRMLDYGLGVRRAYGEMPAQCVLYVGREPLRMAASCSEPDLQFRYRLVDIREIDAESLLVTGEPGTGIMAILARLRNSEETVRRILEMIAALERPERAVALESLLLIGGLRQLEEIIEKEASRMHISDDIILENKVLGREFKRGLEQGLERGLQQGLQQGLEEGVHRGQLKVLRKLIFKRFGPIPPSLDERLNSMASADLESLSLRIMDARSLRELFE